MLQKIQRFGGAMFAPSMLFSISGLMVGVSALATTADIVGDLAVYGTPWYVFWTIIQRGSWTVFKRLPLLFATVAYWYQSEPHAVLAPFAARQDRVPR